MEKPLPDLPQPPKLRLKDTQVSNPVTLTIDARVHLHTFLVQAIQDEGGQSGSLEEDVEEWANALEVALGALGERITMGGWLPGLRRARVRRWDEMERQRVQEIGRMKRLEGTEASTVKKDVEGKAKGADSLHYECNEDWHGYLSTGRNNLHMHSRMDRSWLASLQVLRDAISRQPTLIPKPTAKHLLLTIAPFNTNSHHDIDYEFGRPAVECIFTSGVFSLPQEDAPESDARDTILHGLDSWDWDMWSASDDLIQVVGGTFSFRGVPTDAQYALLRKVLRLATFVYLSNILEQCLLADSHVPLHFPKPMLSPAIPVGPQAPFARALSTSNVGHKPKRESGSLTSWWAFLSRKKDYILQRAATPTRRGSLDLPFTRSLTREVSPIPHGRMSTDSTSSSPTVRSRRISLISDYRPSFMQPHTPHPTEPAPPERPFAAALARIERYGRLLSTSPSITYPAPSLLVTLAEQEKIDPTRRLCGDEKAALASLLGWEGKQACGAGVADMAGFVRQQSISILYSEYVQQPTVSVSRPTTPGSSNSSSAPPLSQSQAQTQVHAILCGRRRRWVTFRFFSRDGGADDCLGDTLAKLSSRADEPCDEPNCRFKRGEHELRFIHGPVRITASIEALPETYQADDNIQEMPEMWESCSVCGKQTSKKRMHDGTYLSSFAKYLELLVYSDTMCMISPPLCQHTALPQRPWTAAETPLPRARMNILRSFSFRGRMISFLLSPLEDVYEVRVPRLQIIKSRPNERAGDVHIPVPRQATLFDADMRTLRREIMRFWQGLSEHIDKLEGNFISEHSSTYHKTLPRLPSADDAFDDFDGEGLATPKGQSSILPPHPPNTPKTPPSVRPEESFLFAAKSADASLAELQPESTPSTLSSTSSSTTEQDSLQLLTSLRHTFQRTEQDLYAELSRTAPSSLNDVRRSFVSAARGATKRLSAWEAKHAAGSTTIADIVASTEPEWWKSGCHAVPGGNVIVREDDWGSIIAFTLSSMDYQKEVANMTSNRATISPSAPPSTPALTRPSFLGKNASTKWFSSSAPPPDPDQDGIVWHEPETYSAVISRKEHPRDPTSLLKLGIPDVLRQKAVPDSPSPGPPKFPALGLSGGKGTVSGAPPLAWAKPDVQLSKEEADGVLSAATVDKVDRVLQELEAASGASGSVRTSSSDHQDHHLSSSAFFETNIRRGKASSILSSTESVSMVGEGHPPTPPPKDIFTEKQALRSPDVAVERIDPALLTPPAPSSASGFANTLSSALRYMLRAGEPPPTSAKHHHGLLSAAASPAIDDKPHIKYDWTIGKRLRFSCTVYYAKQFDALRRRCGIEDVFLQSLARCENWAAEGGKSRSNFWKTTDNQFIIKSLVNAWNVADLHVLIEFGPSYFHYMDATTSKPTVLAKLLGFYTVEIKNLETGNTQAKADLLVMENLFYNQSIVKTFDLKGIQGRKVKPSTNSSGSKTLFDGEWIEGQQRTLTIVRPYSKVVLQEAVKADCDFLMRSNIMDYSLLVGIDESKKQLVCGLVDTIGSYTFAKTIEYKAKQGLNSGKEVTVMPPNEYQERFVNAMDNYFVACPDKWSRPLDDTKIPGDYRHLPSVL